MDMSPLWTCIYLTLCVSAILVQPLLRYVLVGWKAKRKEIMDGLRPKARHAYFLMFSCSEPVPNDLDVASSKFERLYSRWYGRRYYTVPGVLLLLVGLTVVGSVIFSILGSGIFPSNVLFSLPPTAVAALCGAYLWVVNDHIGRARRLDFSPADVMWAVLRIVIAVPMGYAFSSLFSKEVGPFVAFGFGAFPLSLLLSILRRLTERQLRTESTAEESGDDVIKLQGINKSILERLSNEDVTTITQIAYCDPVRLSMRSNLSFNFIIDCMNQALVWMYLSELLNTIRPFGLRGAVEIKYLITDLRSDGDEPADKDTREKAQALLKQIADAVKMNPELLQFAFGQIAEDPYTIFLYEIWETPEGIEGCCPK
jgi:hypothetical protein